MPATVELSVPPLKKHPVTPGPVWRATLSRRIVRNSLRSSRNGLVSRSTNVGVHQRQVSTMPWKNVIDVPPDNLMTSSKIVRGAGIT
jgi:hypothetical protein